MTIILYECVLRHPRSTVFIFATNPSNKKRFTIDIIFLGKIVSYNNQKVACFLFYLPLRSKYRKKW